MGHIKEAVRDASDEIWRGIEQTNLFSILPTTYLHLSYKSVFLITLLSEFF